MAPAVEAGDFLGPGAALFGRHPPHFLTAAYTLYNEVVQPLASEGAELYCQVVIVARGDAAIRENTVELGIKESLGQRGIDADIQTG